MLWILAGVAVALLCYEIPTLVGSVLWPLLNNPAAIQTDFHYYYQAAARVAGDRSLLYLASDDVIAGFAYPPPAILPFVPITRLPLGAALVLVTIASYLALLYAVSLWWSRLARRGLAAEASSLWTTGLIVAALGPTYMNAIFGQVNAFVLVSAVLFVSFARIGALVPGTALALGSALKLYPALMVCVAAWDYRRVAPAVLIAVVMGAVIVGASLAYLPIDAYRTFFAEVLPARSGVTAIHISNQSLMAFLERFSYEPQLYLNWTGQQAVVTSPAVRAANLGVLAAALVALTYVGRSDERKHPAVDAALMALIPIFAPLGWGHAYMMVIPLVITQLLAMRQAPLIGAVTVLCVLAFMVPAGRHLPVDGAPAFLQNILYSRYLLATLALIVTSTMTIGRTGAPPVVSST